MRFGKRQPAEDPAPEEDPLSMYAQPTMRQSVDRGDTQPIEGLGGPTRGSGMQVDGTDFANRPTQRRQRQGGARIYTERVGEIARSMDNRQLLMIGGAVVLLLIALLWWQAARRDDNLPSLGNDPISTVEPGLGIDTGSEGGVDTAPGAIVTTAPGEVISPPVVEPTSAPAVAPAFVVSGTGTEGLFLRPNPSTEGEPIATLPEGTRVEYLNEEQNDGTRTWRKVRTPQGGEGWVASDFIIPEQ